MKKIMSVEKEMIWNQFLKLPEAAQHEVFDFISFIKDRYKRSMATEKMKKKDLKKESFVDLWENRSDMSDSVAWVRKTIVAEWNN